MAALTDFVTVLTCTPGKRAAKAYTRIDAPPDDYDAGFEFGVHEHAVHCLDDLHTLLLELAGERDHMVIRGTAAADVARDGSELVPRRCRATPEQPAAFEAAEHHWFALDIDDCDVPAGAHDRAAVEAWRATLPAGMRAGALVWQWSAKAHLSETVRGRAWFWSATPVSDGRARLLALDLGADRALYNPVQPHYTASPIMPEGVDDPITERVLWFDGGEAVLPEAETKRTHSRDERPLPDVSAIVAAVGDANAYTGGRWLLLGAIAGMMRRAGLSARHGEAFVRAWLADATPSATDRAKGLSHPDVRVALDRMLGAWSQPADLVSGAAAFDDPALGDRVWRACKPADGELMRFRPEVLAARAEREPHGVPATATAGELGREWLPLDGPVRELRYLCRGLGLAYVGKCAAVHGFAGAGKGPLLTLIALAVAAGKPVLGHAVERAPVLYLDAETGELAEIRAQRIARAMGVDAEALRREGWLRVVHVDRSLEDLMPAIEATAHGMGAGLICADSYSSLVSGEENSSEYADALWELGRLGQRVGAVPLVTMHERKAQQAGARAPGALESISGTNRLAAALATSIRLTPSSANDNVITVACTRAPEKRFAPIELTWTDGPNGELAAGFAEAVLISPAEAARERKRADTDAKLDAWVASADRLLADAGVRPLAPSAIARGVGVSGSNTDKLVEALVSRRIAERTFDAKGHVLYVWTPPEHRGYKGAPGKGPRAFARGR
jgi:hypothetical protein